MLPCNAAAALFLGCPAAACCQQSGCAALSCAQLYMCTCLQGLERLSQFDYVGIFDADFKPDPDFLVSFTVLSARTDSMPQP